MSHKVFLSFEYKPDNWRVSQIKQIGAIEGTPLLSANEWETVKRGGDDAIKRWINDNMRDKEALVVLIGANTANRKWVQYEIMQAWNTGKGVFGIHIHNLKDRYQMTSNKGANPFSNFTVENSTSMQQIVKTYDPPLAVSTFVYSHISTNFDNWVDESIRIRRRYL